MITPENDKEGRREEARGENKNKSGLCWHSSSTHPINESQ